VAYLFLIPGLISLYYVIQGKQSKAFLNVYLPCTLLLPYYYHFRIPHLPPLSAGDAALLPLGLSLLFKPKVAWKFKRMDLWVLIFVTSYAISEVTKDYVPKDGMVQWMQVGFTEMFLGYVVGRQVIEPELRLETVKRIVFLFMAQTVFAFYEFRFGSNPWLNLGRGFFGITDIGWFVQLRGGTARIATCFSGAIVAGMVFMVAACLNYYLVQLYKLDKTRLGPRMSLLQKYRLPFFLLPIFVFMSGSRMPMACTVLAFLILQIPRFKSLRTGMIVIFLIAGIGAAGVYAYFQKYTAAPENDQMDEAQTSAIYRKDLIINYAPILEAGGLIGWGSLNPPMVIGQTSIDNGYMLVQLSQGNLGLWTFKLIMIESVLTLFLFALRFKNRESLFLVFSLMGAVIGVWVSLTTVGMGEQTPQIMFLLFGWSQSLQDTSVLGVGARAVSSSPEPKFRFKRVIA
jgi:hypothetical protein